ncbi:DUF2971 domain-containing protein [Paludibacterium sp. THUN1379]|uniref:DUF2971 domain-containing protein n=1 Tax=Paludibacterium sp. THUN1379 TaxID=3112107 RepID=UPI0030CB6258
MREAGVKGGQASEHAEKQAFREAERQLADIAYHARNPDHDGSIEEKESCLLLNAIEHELHHWYEQGVCCFSTSYSSPLLWSHYGDQHKGLCIGYTADRNPAPKLQKVAYGGSRTITSSMLCEAFLHGNEDVVAAINKNVLLRKARGWSYESEWRLIKPQGLQKSPLLLTEVTFGLRCPPPVIHTVIRALERRENCVKFFKIHEVRNSFALRRRQVDVDELQAVFPVTAKSGIEIFGAPDRRAGEGD